MRPKKAANAWFLVIALLALVAFVGCDLAGYDITNLEAESRKGKPGDSVASTIAWTPQIYLGDESDIAYLDPPVVTEYDPAVALVEDPNGTILANGTSYRIAGTTDVATHNLVGERLLGYVSGQYGFWAGQDNDAGTVTISNDQDNFYIEIDTNGLADIQEYHIYAYSSTSELPTKRPAPGLAPFVAEAVNADATIVSIPFSFFGATVDTAGSYYFIIHAALSEDAGGSTGGSLAGETAYAAGPDTPSFDGKGAWFYVVGYSIRPVIELIIVPVGSTGGGGGTDHSGWGAETAWAGDSTDGTKPWWYYFDASAEGYNTVQAIYAGQNLVPGATATYDKATGLLTIDLGDNLALQDVSEPVKIQGYALGELPDRRPSAGLFDTKLGTGDSLVNIVVGSYHYLAIHLDVLVKLL